MELYYLITISDRDRAEMLSAIYHAALPIWTGMVLTKLGRGTATGEQLSSYGLDATEKAVVSTVADAEQTRQIFRAAKRKLFIDIPGNGVMMAIPLKSVAGGRTLGFLTDSTQTGGKPAMDFSHELIMAIMNEGYSDTVMDAARSAGAGGGTVLPAKGTGRARAEKFFGVSLADEKDVVYIVAHAEEKAAIMQAIADNAGPYKNAIVAASFTVSLEIRLPKQRTSLRFLTAAIAAQKSTAIVVIFIPPAVEPDAPPISINAIVTRSDASLIFE